MAAKNIDDYISTFGEETQIILEKVRKAISEAAPTAEESIVYAIPTFRWNGKNLVHFGGFKSHLGFYPTPSGITKFKKELSKYDLAKGSVKFPMKMVKSSITPNGIIVASYSVGGDVKHGSFATENPSELELERREKMRKTDTW